jgi:ABC-type uncharacterized transport system permease subunit
MACYYSPTCFFSFPLATGDLMRIDLLLSLSATLVLMAGSFAGFRQSLSRDARFWSLIGAGFVGSGAAAGVSLKAFGFGLAAALWLTVASVLAVFAVLVWARPISARLGTLLFPYLALLALLALASMSSPGETAETSIWGLVHAGVALIANALVTVAAIAAFAVVIQERALKAHRRSLLAGMLPGAAESEGVQGVLLGIAAAALALGIATGSAVLIEESGRALVFNHKTVLTVLALILIASLSILDLRRGLGGRRLARGILVSWLVLTLGFLGVIFIKHVIL